jgi:hypothetical protein
LRIADFGLEDDGAAPGAAVWQYGKPEYTTKNAENAKRWKKE